MARSRPTTSKAAKKSAFCDTLGKINKTTVRDRITPLLLSMERFDRISKPSNETIFYPYLKMPSRISELLEPHFASIQQLVNNDQDFVAAANGVRCTFAISSSENPQESVIVGIDQLKVALSIDAAHAGIFGIQARPEDWDAFFATTLVRPYQSFWGVLRVLGHNKGIGVLGDQYVH